MSLIENLNDENKWDEFLKTKEESNNIPSKVVKEYRDFIDNKKYKAITTSILNGEYEFSLPNKVLIGKMGKSKKRVVYIYKEDENYVLKMLSFLLYHYDEMFSPNLYSFRKNSGVKKAINKIRSLPSEYRKFAYKVDLSNYFNSIPTDILLKELKEDLKDEKLYNLINSLISNPKVMYNGNVILEEKGIMAGVPISSFLANYYLKDLDWYFYNQNILYARYADDIIVFGKTKREIEEYRKNIIEFIQKRGLTVNAEKEKFYNESEKIEFLGFSLENNVIDINQNSFKKIKGKIRRTARGLRRWMIKKNVSGEVTLKAMNRKFNRKFFGKNENDLTWKSWFFPVINTDKTLKKIDNYMQDEQRYLITGVHNKKNFEKVPYEFLKSCNYKSLVNEYYKSKSEKNKID